MSSITDSGDEKAAQPDYGTYLFVSSLAIVFNLITMLFANFNINRENLESEVVTLKYGFWVGLLVSLLALGSLFLIAEERRDLWAIVVAVPFVFLFATIFILSRKKVLKEALWFERINFKDAHKKQTEIQIVLEKGSERSSLV
mmetsp:Transcript_3762/g.5667  ORF Transcript_3762/g.5667 Transcript_3762/m.5667 type:complete len:143 (+) Transcript_3762:199-627(+)